MANLQRGEIPIKLDGVEYTLRPTFNAICEIESRTGLGIAQLILKAESGNTTLKDVVYIIWAGIKAHDKRLQLSFDETLDLIQEETFASVLLQKHEDENVIANFLLNCITGGRELTEAEPNRPKKPPIKKKASDRT